MSNNIKEMYTYITTKSEDMQCIGIKKGMFHGVVYKYVKVSFGEETDDGRLTFSFEFDILDNNLIPKEEFGEDWSNLIGDILVDIIDEQGIEDDESNNRENSIN